jgi:hypothetical protein
MVLVGSVGVGWVEWGGRCRVECNVVVLADPQHKKNVLASENVQSHAWVRSRSCRSIVYLFFYVYIYVHIDLKLDE